VSIHLLWNRPPLPLKRTPPDDDGDQRVNGRIGHGRINMQEVNKIIDLRVETHRHRRLMNDFSSAMADHRNTASFDVDDDHRSVLSRRAHDGAGDDLDFYFFENFSDGLANLRFVAVREQLLAALDNCDIDVARRGSAWLPQSGFSKEDNPD
jgi:hypothetical protein